MRIGHQIGILVIACSVGGLALAMGISRAHEHLDTRQRELGSNSIAISDLERLEDNLQQYLTLSDLILAGGETYLIDGAHTQTRRLLELADSIRHSPLAQATDAIAHLIRFIRWNDETLATSGTIAGDARDTYLNEKIVELDQRSATVVASVDLLSAEMRARAAVQQGQVLRLRDMLAASSGIACFIYIVLVGSLWRWTVATMIRPLQHLTEATDEAIRQEQPLQLNEHGPTEVRRLTASVKSCVSSLEEKVSRRTAALANQQEELQKQVKERVAAEERLRHAAYHDALTSLPNRVMLIDRLGQCVHRAQRDPEFTYAVLFIDLDNFKYINDSLGHDVGDELLIQVSTRLTDCLRGLDTVSRDTTCEGLTARLGGDEFVILLESLSDVEDAVVVVERLQEVIAKPYKLRDHEVVISSSIGIAISSADRRSAEILLRDADTAMYRAKSGGKARHAVFDTDMHEDAIKRLHVEGDLRRAVAEGQFQVYYQPIVELSTRRIRSFEALVRWIHPDRGFVSPVEFISVAEENGLIVDIGRFVLEQACADTQAWNEALGADSIGININISKRQIAEPGFVDEVRAVLARTRIPGHLVRLEVTESTVMENSEAVVDVLHELRTLGIELHMDDFGTGYSSLSCIHRFPIDVLKIDREFVMTMEKDEQYAAVVQAITMLAHALDIRVTAEGIETEEQAGALGKLHCNYGQGYLYSRPLPASDARAYLFGQIDDSKAA